MTILAGVVGWPIGHSLSPRLHGYWLREHRIDGAYVPLAVRREDFSTAVAGLRRAEFAGLNVTVPHKEAGFSMAHTLDEDARLTGAVNLLLFHGDVIEGRNTDAMGLSAGLREEFGSDVVRGKPAVLLGAGGAARSAILGVAREGAAEIHVLNRNRHKANALVGQLQPNISAKLVAAGLDGWPDASRDAGLVVNATSAGMAGNAALDFSLEGLPKMAAIYDLVYNPRETALVKRARARGLRAANGLGMLMQQAVPAFAVWYGVTPKVTPELRAHLEQALAA